MNLNKPASPRANGKVSPKKASLARRPPNSKFKMNRITKHTTTVKSRETMTEKPAIAKSMSQNADGKDENIIEKILNRSEEEIEEMPMKSFQKYVLLRKVA